MGGVEIKEADNNVYSSEHEVRWISRFSERAESEREGLWRGRGTRRVQQTQHNHPIAGTNGPPAALSAWTQELTC